MFIDILDSVDRVLIKIYMFFFTKTNSSFTCLPSHGYIMSTYYIHTIELEIYVDNSPAALGGGGDVSS